MLIARSLVLAVMSLVPGIPDPLPSDIVFSDRYIVELGKPYPVVDGTKYYAEADGGVICLKRNGDRWFIQKLSAQSLSQISRKEYDDMPKDMVVEHIGYFGERFFLFYSLWDKTNEREQLFYRDVDTEAGTFMGKSTLMISVNGKVTGTMRVSGFYRFFVSDKFEMMFSEDEKRMFVQYEKRLGKKEREDNPPISMAMFDSELSLEWSGDVTLPTHGKTMDLKDYTIDNDGVLCVLASAYLGNEEKAKDQKEEDFQYQLLRKDGEADWRVTPLDLPGMHIESMTLFQDATGTMRAGGFYSKSAEREAIDGLFVCSFDDNDNIIDAGIHEIPDRLINMYTRSKELKKRAKAEADGEDLGFKHLTLRTIFHDDDGEMLLVGEKRYMTVRCVTDSRGNTRCYDVYHADDLVVASIGADGSANWMQRIPKRSASGVPHGRTFKLMSDGDEHHIVRFDKDLNLNIQPDEVPEIKGTTIVMVDRLDARTGEVQREAILNTEEIKGIRLYQLAMDRLVRVGDTELVMEAYKKSKEDVLVRIQVRE